MDTEYITEWPPPPPSSPGDNEGGNGGEEGEEGEVLKKPRLDKEDTSPLVRCSPMIKADALLARWWKEKMRSEGGQSLPVTSVKSTNPNTALFHISRLSQAKDFMWQRIRYLLSLNDVSESHVVEFSLATCYHMLGNNLQFVVPALQHAEVAMETADEENMKEVKWLVELLQRQKRIEEKKEKGSKLMEKWSAKRHKMPQFTQVERRTQSKLSRVEFYERYVMTHTPVVITDVVVGMTSTAWTLESVRKVIGHRVAMLKKVVPGSVEWAQLENTGDCQVGEFIASLDSPGDGNECRYLFDWSLPLNCPELMTDLKIPQYFAENVFLRTPEESLYHKSWPSLFIAPAGITSELHVDAFSSNFWMALFEGKKRWVFFPPDDLPFLYPTYFNSMDAIFEVDLSKWSACLPQYPLLALTHPQECVLEAGELLFVPFGCPHRVENLEKSLAISANFVDSSNRDAVKKELVVNGLLDPRAEDLLRILEDDEKPEITS